MDYCGPRGLPHSEFKTWDPLDQAKALSWTRREQEKCGGCGIHPEVWDLERGGHPDALHLESRLCRTCEISETSRKDYESSRIPGEHQVWRPTDP